MISLKKQKGFTIVELLIVIIVIGILATLVLVTFEGIQAKARDAKRQTDIDAIDSQLEAYFAENGNYPTLTNMQTGTWVASNLKGLDPNALVSPDGGAIAGTATEGPDWSYGYATTPANCDDNTTPCTGFTLTADLESSSTPYVKNSLT